MKDMDSDTLYEVTIRRQGIEETVIVRSDCLENAIDKATTPTTDDFLSDTYPELIGAREQPPCTE